MEDEAQEPNGTMEKSEVFEWISTLLDTKKVDLTIQDKITGLTTHIMKFE